MLWRKYKFRFGKRKQINQQRTFQQSIDIRTLAINKFLNEHDLSDLEIIPLIRKKNIIHSSLSKLYVKSKTLNNLSLNSFIKPAF